MLGWVPSKRQSDQACSINSPVTALSLYGGMRFPFAIGALVESGPTTLHTPLSGHTSPVLALVPIGIFGMVPPLARIRSYLTVATESSFSLILPPAGPSPYR